MKDDTLIQYGVAIDPQLMVQPKDITELELDPLTPGLDDPDYVARRRFLFDLCRRHRLANLGPPIVEYLPEEVRVWREVSPKLDELHVKYASEIYLRAKRDLAITTAEIPQLRHVSDRLERETNVRLVPAEGSLAYRTFYQYIAGRGPPA